MSAPNIVEITTITGKSSVLALTTSPQAIVENPAASGQVIKLNQVMVANVDGTNACNLTVDLYRGSAAYRLLYLIAVPARASLIAIAKDACLYLEEGDSLRLTASADSDLEAVCSYEVLS